MEAAADAGVKVHTQGRLKNAPGTSVDGDQFLCRGGGTSCVMILEPMTPFLNYYEYEILDIGVEASIGIGVGERSYPLNRMPGWNRNGIGYHGDDGKLYHESGRGKAFGPKCFKGDRVGCGIDFDSEAGYGYHDVFFTKNGQQVGEVVRMKRPVYGLYPIIGLHSRGEKVRYLGHWHRQRQTLLEPMVQDHSPCNMWLRSNGIKFLEDGLTLEYCGNGGEAQDVSLAQGRHPLDRTNHYFELEILNVGSLGAIAIGVGKSSYPLHSHPGWSAGAVGYHADDGKLFVEVGRGEDFGPSCANGDLMGCGVDFGSPDDAEAAEEECGKPAADGVEEEGWESDTTYSPDEDEDEDIYDFDDEAMFYRQLLDREHFLGGLGRGGRGGRGGPFGGRGLFGGPLANIRGRLQRRNGPPGLGVAQVRNTCHDSIVANSGAKCKVFFTKNGERLGEVEVHIPKGGFFPLVGLLSKGEKVRVDLQPLTG